MCFKATSKTKSYFGQLALHNKSIYFSFTVEDIAASNNWNGKNQRIKVRKRFKTGMISAKK